MENKNDAILDIRELNVTFKVGRTTVSAVNGVSLQARRGKTLGIVGESGCGKSVTAHSIMKLLPKIASVRADKLAFFPEPGREVNLLALRDNSREMRSIRGNNIAMIFQDPMSCLNPVYTIGDQISENILEHNKKISSREANQRVIETLQRLGIPDADRRIHEYPHEFSGGMKQRVMIGMGIINNPQLLIADEPTTALDVTIQAQILELMQEIQQAYGTTIILITHNMGIVADMADDIAVMYMGRIVEYGTREQIFREHLHPYTTALLRSVPVLGHGKRTRLEPIRGTTPDPTDMPKGCAFAPRCDLACGRCAELPPTVGAGGGHTVACWMCGGCKGGDANG